MVVFALMACTSEPVPAHETLVSDVVARLLAGEPDQAASSVAPYLTSAPGLSSADATRWGATMEAARTVSGARRASEVREGLVAMLSTCTTCHEAGEAYSMAPGHSGAFEALQRSVITGDANWAKKATAQLKSDPSLGMTRKRVLDLGSKMERWPEKRPQLYGRLLEECARCHPARSLPVPVGPGDGG